jgi:hypothetical protein
MTETEIRGARFSPNFVDQIRKNVRGLVVELQLKPGEAEAGLAYLLGEMLAPGQSRARRHADALREIIVTVGDQMDEGFCGAVDA